MHRTISERTGFLSCITVCTVLVVCSLLIGATTLYAAPKNVQQKSFASPEEAVKAFVEALKGQNQKELRAILGSQSNTLIQSGDPVVDKTERQNFAQLYDEQNRIQYDGTAKAILHVGKNDWPVPLPMVKKGSKWFFDPKGAQEEILNRRIGRNELAVIEVMREYVDAQREYAAKDRDGDGILEFAQKFESAKGQQDGLFWETKVGEEASPLGPLAARATREGYTKKAKKGQPVPFHGYIYRVLKGQGKNAVGGAYSYMVNDNMILGFGLVAYPAKYGSSGIMTFMVNQEGKVYEKNFGKDTEKTASAITLFDPDATWKKIEDADSKQEKK
jgi:hypothetical protein